MFSGGGATCISSPLEFLGNLKNIESESFLCNGCGTEVPEGLRKFTLTRIAKFTKFIKQFNPLTKREGKESSHPELVTETQYKKSPLPPFRKRGLRLCLPCKGGGTKVPEGLFKRRKVAFTLAEVLITLGIIGIVAAMTLPSLIGHYRKQEICTRLQKFSSTMQNAINMSTVDNGPAQYWVTPTQQDDTKDELVSAYINKYIYPYLTGIKKCDIKDPDCKNIGKTLFPNENSQQQQSIYIFEDGSCFTIFFGGVSETSGMIHIIYDYNCMKKPNEYDKDQFSFVIHYQSGNSTQFSGGSYATYNINNRDTLLELCKDHTATHKGGGCSALIEYDGWEIKDDYPWL